MPRPDPTVRRLRPAAFLLALAATWMATLATTPASAAAAARAGPHPASDARSAHPATARDAVPAVAAGPAVSAPAEGASAPGAATGPATEPEAPPVSAAARRLYEAARPRLLQVRTLLKDQDSQSTVGSGSLVGPQGLVLTNYHVVSQVALQPENYRLTFATADGRKGDLAIVAVDVLHDLALVRMVDPPASLDLAARGVMPFRDEARPLAQGEPIFSLGNPLDVGFAVVEGTYNGLVERRFLPQILFSGALSPGMSGGPVLDDRGRIVGVNVATMRNGQLVSFLVPARFAQALLARGAASPPMAGALDAEVARQLMAHQADLVARFIRMPWRATRHSHYLVPVPQEDFMRCWGATSPAGSKGLEFERTMCQMDSDVFVHGGLSTGWISVRHEVYDGRRLGVLRFSDQYARSFANEAMGHRTRDLTAPRCREDFVESGGLPMRSVLCLRAYRRLKGLYDLTVLTTSVDAGTEGVQGRFDAHGVSFPNALALARHYLRGFGWTTTK